MSGPEGEKDERMRRRVVEILHEKGETHVV